MKKNRKKPALSMLLCALIALTACGSVTQDVGATPVTTNSAAHIPQTTQPLQDQPSDWALEAVETARALGFIPETVRGSYQSPTTRAEFTAFATALYEVVMGREITGRTTFNDTNDINVEKMGYLGVVAGVGNGNFAPDQTLTREQAAVMLARLANVLGNPLPIVPPTFYDNTEASGWALESIGQMQAAGIMGGTGNNMFSPLGLYTREQSIITILRLYEMLEEEPPTTSQPTEPRREFNMNDPNVQTFPILATARTPEELREGTLGWGSAADTRAIMHDEHPDRLVDGMTVYEWRLRPIFAWMDEYKATRGICIEGWTDYQKTQVIHWVIEDGLLEEFIGLWRPGFRHSPDDCVPRSEGVAFMMLAMDFELYRQISGRHGASPHTINAFWDAEAVAVRFIDANPVVGIWNLFVDELIDRRYTINRLG